MTKNCFHCGEVVPKNFAQTVLIFKKEQAMCCIGCQSVAQTIIDNNLSHYYQFRTENATKATPLIPLQIQRNKLLDEDTLQSEFTHRSENANETILTIEGLSCAACAWLIEKQLSQVQGVISINVNATTQRATLKWNPSHVKLSSIFSKIESIGFQALPFKESSREEANKLTSKAFIKRLGVSGILMMQVMMIATGLYFGEFSGMAPHYTVYLRWTSLLLTLPIIIYGAYPFYKGAFNAIKAAHLTMDVPVSIAIILAFSASAWATISQQGDVYFESVAMFTFLLLIGKYLEFRARARAAEVSANLLKMMPLTAVKLVDNKELYIAARNLEKSDMVLIKPGEIVPADGKIMSGCSQLNEAMLSGEPLPVNKNLGDKVFAGTINGDSNLVISVEKTSSNTFLSQLIRLSESSQAHKPKIAKLSDKIAQYFVLIILICSCVTAVYWHFNDPERAFWITLSVLVATCPCALSLATPTALTCATTRLNSVGIMIKSSHVMETIPKVNLFAFDKTGTLTNGHFSICKTNIVAENYTEDNILAIAAALESHSEHPLAHAFNKFRDYSISMTNVEVVSGAGIKGDLAEKHFQIGRPTWLLSSEQLERYKNSHCVLLCNNELIAGFELTDKIRDDALSLFSSLTKLGIDTMMLSGDNEESCKKVAHHLSIKHYFSGLTALNKMDLINQKTDKTIAMVGDGVNDTPVFGAAHISIAMGSGTDIAKSGADVILLSNKLAAIELLSYVAKKTVSIIKQNYAWAFGYNALILPLAVSGYITPYMAVIGMSASSIFVITNSLRLLKK